MTARGAPERPSPYWNLAAPLRLRLRSHVKLGRQIARGRTWYTLHDPASGRFYRFSPEAYLVIGLLDGRATVGEILEQVRLRLGADAPTSDEVLRLLTQLHNADALQGDLPPDLDELTARSTRTRQLLNIQRLKSPLAIRVPILDPNRFLDHTSFIGKVLFSRPGFVIWLALVIYAGSQAGAHWTELTGNLADRVLAADNLILMALAFIFAKTFHELGHGYAIKRWGGDVHEIGVLFIVLAPMPYVDASSSTSFPSKWQRAAVGAAGVYVELLVAALALLLWLKLEPGIVRSAAFNLVFVASVSTLLFNANPLLRYDGYYVLGDVLGVPNLGPQSLRYLSYLVQRYLLGVSGAVPRIVSRSEALLLVVYGIASFCYRVFVLLLIALFLAQRYFFVGVLLTLWVVLSSFVLPVLKAMRFLLTSPMLARGRVRALTGAGGAVTAVLLLLFAVPMALTTSAEGIIWPPPAAEVAAGTGGFVSAVLVSDGEQTCASCPVIELVDSELPARIAMLEARRQALLARYQAEYGESLVKAQLTQNEIRHVEEQLATEQDKVRRLKVLAPNPGAFVRASPEDMLGRFVPRGTVVGYVVRDEDLLVRAIVRQDDIGLVREVVQRVSVRLSSAVSQRLEAELVRAIPLASDRLPNMALSSIGGGSAALDPDDKKDIRALEKYFEFHFRVKPPHAPLRMGERAHVQIVHGVEPLALQWWRRIRQLFLRQFSV